MESGWSGTITMTEKHSLLKGYIVGSVLAEVEKKVTVFWLSIWEGFFKISVFIPEKSREEVLGLPVSEDFKDVIKESKRMGEKLKYYPLIFEAKTEEFLNDLFVLFEFRKNT